MTARSSDSTDDAAEPARTDDDEYVARFRRDYQPAPSAESATATDAPPAAAAAAVERTAAIDPRFDPRFQRGYDAERHEQLRRPVLPREVDDRPAYSSTVKPAMPRSAPVDPLAGIAERAAAQRARNDTRRSAGVDERRGDRSADPADDRDLDVRDDVPEAAASVPAGRNPYVIALWIACGLLVLLGAWTIVQASANPTARFVASVAVGDVFARTAWTIGPLCVTVGLLGLVGLTLAQAVAWLRRHPEGER